MNRKLEIFESVLTSPFNNDSFVGFVREFLNNVDNYNEKTIGNIIGTNLGINHYAMFDRIAEKMFFNGCCDNQHD